MNTHLVITLTALAITLGANAGIICKEDFSNSETLKSIQNDGTAITDPSLLKTAPFFWGPWQGYSPLADNAAFVGSHKRTIQCSGEETNISAGDTLWFSITLDLQNQFSLYPLGTFGDKANDAENLHIQFEPGSRALLIKTDEKQPTQSITLERNNHYLLIGKYEFLAENRTRLQIVTIPSDQTTDLTKGVDFSSTGSFRMLSAEANGHPRSLAPTQISMAVGSLVGNFRLATDYMDIGISLDAVTELPQVVAPVIAAKAATSVTKLDTQKYLIAGGSVAAVVLLGGLGWFFASSKKRQSEVSARKYNDLIHTFSGLVHHEKKVKTDSKANKKFLPAERAKPKFMEEPEPKSAGLHDDDDDEELVPHDWIATPGTKA